MSRNPRRPDPKAQSVKSGPARESQIAALYAQAAEHQRIGEWLAAEAACRSILALDQKHLPALFALGGMAARTGRYEEAAGFFRQVVKIRRDFAAGQFELSRALAATGQIEEAAAALDRAISIAQANPTEPGPDVPMSLLGLGYLYERMGDPAKAQQQYERALSLRPELAEAHNNLGALFAAQGKRAEAAASFAKALLLSPEQFDRYSDIVAMLLQLDPALADGVARATAAWPGLTSGNALLGAGGVTAIADNALLLCVLESAPVRDIALEKFLTWARAAILDLATASKGNADGTIVRFACALARQCFINEYVFIDTAEELARVEALKRSLLETMAAGAPVDLLQLAATASYFPLSSLPGAPSMLGRDWPEPVKKLLVQQIIEVEEEKRARDTIPRLTAIDGASSDAVRQQYEENPYPRWVLAPSRRPPITVDEDLRLRFPAGDFRPFDERTGIDILVAGCGTGEHPIRLAQRYNGARILAVDLSLSSLCYAKRKTSELGLQNIEYAQADILQIGALDRTFDIIDVAGVLHHLADPNEGWRRLLPLLRPHGLMHVALYSELGRADVVAARKLIAERGFQSTAADIRRCRQELLGTSFRTLTRFYDFFSTSDCRDLLFHVSEHRLTVPDIKAFLAANDLRFLGFELDDHALRAYRARFPDDPAMTDLDCWHVFEQERPSIFAAMYQFDVKKR